MSSKDSNNNRRWVPVKGRDHAVVTLLKEGIIDYYREDDFNDPPRIIIVERVPVMGNAPLPEFVWRYEVYELYHTTERNFFYVFKKGGHSWESAVDRANVELDSLNKKARNDARH